jgi:hypothetical protein
MIAQTFDSTRDDRSERDSALDFPMLKIQCGFKDHAGAFDSADG